MDKRKTVGVIIFAAIMLVSCKGRAVNVPDNDFVLLKNSVVEATEILRASGQIDQKNNDMTSENEEVQNEDVQKQDVHMGVTVKRVSRPITNDEGEVLANVYYERPVLLDDCQAAQKINQFFEQEEKIWLEGKAGKITEYMDDYYTDFQEGVELMRERYGDEVLIDFPLRYTISTIITLLDNDMLSILQIRDVMLGHKHCHYYGYTFDLKSGEQIPLNTLANITPEGMKKIIGDMGEMYDALKDENYVIHYGEDEIAMNYEYYYDGNHFFIIINQADIGGFQDGEIREWNGRWGDAYEVTSFWYWIYPLNEEIEKEIFYIEEGERSE